MSTAMSACTSRMRLDVVGTSFRLDDVEEAYAEHMCGVQSCRLERDRFNKFDPNAVRVIVSEKFVGFVKRERVHPAHTPPV